MTSKRRRRIHRLIDILGRGDEVNVLEEWLRDQIEVLSPRAAHAIHLQNMAIDRQRYVETQGNSFWKTSHTRGLYRAMDARQQIRPLP